MLFYSTLLYYSNISLYHFNEAIGLDAIKKLASKSKGSNKTLEIESSSKYYCLAACAALIKYIDVRKNIIFAPDSLKIQLSSGHNSNIIYIYIHI